MVLGLLSAILADHTLEEVIGYAAGEGYRCVELACWPKGKAERRYAGVCHLDMDTLDAQRAAEVQALCAEKGVAISALSYYANPLSPDAAAAEGACAHIKKLIAAAPMLGVSRVNTFIGRDKDKGLEENLDRFSAVWPELIRYAEDRGVRVGIENCPMYFSRDEWPGGCNLAISPAVWRQMFQIIPSPNFGLNYDPSHLYLQGMDYIRPLYEFRDRIFHVHFKDVKILLDKRDDCGIFSYPLDYMSPKLPGLGDIDWGAFVSALYDIGYDGPACVEIEDKRFEASGADIARACRLAGRYMRQFVE